MITIEEEILISLIAKAEDLISSRRFMLNKINDVIELNKINSKKANELDDITTRIKKFMKKGD